MTKVHLAAYALRVVHKAKRIRWPHIETRDVVFFLLLGASLLFTAHYVNSTQAAARHQAQQQQASQRQAGLALERQLCSTFGKAAALKPPAGDPRTNPSRAYLQGQHVVWAEVVTDLHCDRLPRRKS